MANQQGGNSRFSYIGTAAFQPINIWYLERDPTAFDTQGYSLGDIALNVLSDEPFMLVSLAGNSMSKGQVAVWTPLGGASAGATTFPTNSGTATEAAGILNILGDGTTINTSGVGNTVTISLVGSAIESFHTDSGNATPSSNIVTIKAGTATQNSGSSVKITGSGSTVLLNVTDASGNTIIGNSGGNGALSGGSNSGLGFNIFNSLTSGANNSVLGKSAASHLTSGSGNVIAGYLGGLSITSGSENVLLGDSVAGSLLTGSTNVILGDGAGLNYVGAESNNVLISNAGVAAESNVIRIGTQGTGSGQQNATYIAGIYNTTVGATTQTVVVDSTGKLGSKANTSVGDWVLINTQSVNNVGSVVFDNTMITSTYDTYVLIVSNSIMNISLGSTYQFLVQLATGGGVPVWATANYNSNANVIGSIVSTDGSGQGFMITPRQTYAIRSPYSTGGTYYFYNMNSATYYVNYTGTTSAALSSVNGSPPPNDVLKLQNIINGGLYFGSVGPFTSLRLIDSANNNFSGKFSLYGIVQ